MEDLKELSRIAEAATPGPWECVEGDEAFGLGSPVGCLTWDDHSGEVFKKEDAEFIATFDPPTVLALITELETFRRRLDAMRRQRDGYRNQLRRAEQQVALVRELREGQLCGHCADEVQDALDGDGRG